MPICDVFVAYRQLCDAVTALQSVAELYTFAVNDLQHSALSVGRKLQLPLAHEEKWKKSSERLRLLLELRLTAQTKKLESLSLQDAVEIACKLMEEVNTRQEESLSLKELLKETTKELQQLQTEHEQLLEDKQKQIIALTLQLESRPQQLLNNTDFSIGTKTMIPAATVPLSTVHADSQAVGPLLPEQVISAIRREKGFDIEVRVKGVWLEFVTLIFIVVDVRRNASMSS